MTKQMLINAFHATSAYIGYHGMTGVDLILPVLLASGDISCIYVQVKNAETYPGPSSIYEKMIKFQQDNKMRISPGLALALSLRSDPKRNPEFHPADNSPKRPFPLLSIFDLEIFKEILFTDDSTIARLRRILNTYSKSDMFSLLHMKRGRFLSHVDAQPPEKKQSLQTWTVMAKNEYDLRCCDAKSLYKACLISYLDSDDTMFPPAFGGIKWNDVKRTLTKTDIKMASPNLEAVATSSHSPSNGAAVPRSKSKPSSQAVVAVAESFKNAEKRHVGQLSKSKPTFDPSPPSVHQTTCSKRVRRNPRTKDDGENNGK